MIEEVKIPEISENVESGTIIQVLVEVGDMIDIDDVLVEFETEKALVEIPSTVRGKITELLAKKGDEMRVGDVIARVDTGSRTGDKDTAESEPATDDTPKIKEEEKQKPPEEPAPAEAPEAVKAEVVEEEQDAAPAPEKPADAPQPAGAQKKTEDHPADRGPAPATPSVRRLARELGVDIYDVKASGSGGRITGDDVKAHVKKGERPDKTAPPGVAAAEMTAEPELPDFSRWLTGSMLALKRPNFLSAAAQTFTRMAVTVNLPPLWATFSAFLLINSCKPVMSAWSNWVTCGTVRQAVDMLAAVMRRTPSSSTVSTSPQRLKSGSSGSAVTSVGAVPEGGILSGRSPFLIWAFTSSSVIRPPGPEALTS